MSLPVSTITKPACPKWKSKLLYQPIANLGQHIKPPHLSMIRQPIIRCHNGDEPIWHQAYFVKSQRRMTEAGAWQTHRTRRGKSTIAAYVERIGIFTQTDVCRAIGQKLILPLRLCWTLPILKSIRCINRKMSGSLADHATNSYPPFTHYWQSRSNYWDFGANRITELLTNHSNLIVARIEQAQSFRGCCGWRSNWLVKFIREQHASGIKIHVISRMVQSLNLQVFAKVWQLIVPAITFYNTCLFVMGSEGRGEQILRTDQDNALIIRNGFKDDNLPSYAAQFNEALANMGYPYCDGKIMPATSVGEKLQPPLKNKSRHGTWVAVVKIWCGRP